METTVKITLSSTNPTAVLLAGAVLSLFALSGCSSDHSMGGMSNHSTPATSTTPSYGPAATGTHNAQDVTFLTDMIPHHAQAVDMADLVLSRVADADVKALATQIKAAQSPEISQMSGWLIGWGESLPASGGSDHSMVGMHGSDGMMSDSEMTELDQASGTEFARLFLTGMTRHHQGAVEMARAELSSGQNAQAKALATAILTAQEQEIATMGALLSKLGG
jgi:uncharacterized protein (DUF305 family)